MAINSILTPEDLSRTEGIAPGWYPMEIVSYDEAVTKGSEAKPSDGSMNAIFTLKILEGSKESPQAKGKEFKRYFNEKSLYFGKNLFTIIVPGFDPKKGGNVSTEAFKASVGKKLQGYVSKDKKSGYDTIEDYRPLSN